MRVEAELHPRPWVADWQLRAPSFHEIEAHVSGWWAVTRSRRPPRIIRLTVARAGTEAGVEVDGVPASWESSDAERFRDGGFMVPLDSAGVPVPWQLPGRPVPEKAREDFWGELLRTVVGPIPDGYPLQKGSARIRLKQEVREASLSDWVLSFSLLTPPRSEDPTVRARLRFLVDSVHPYLVAQGLIPPDSPPFRFPWDPAPVGGSNH